MWNFSVSPTSRSSHYAGSTLPAVWDVAHPSMSIFFSSWEHVLQLLPDCDHQRGLKPRRPGCPGSRSRNSFSHGVPLGFFPSASRASHPLQFPESLEVRSQPGRLSPWMSHCTMLRSISVISSLPSSSVQQCPTRAGQGEPVLLPRCLIAQQDQRPHGGTIVCVSFSVSSVLVQGSCLRVTEPSANSTRTS